jgi:hypothetical protein
MTYEETFRQDLIEALRRELIGPDLPPHGIEIPEGQAYEETLDESPLQRYSAGVLFPASQAINEVDNSDAAEVAEEPPSSEVPEAQIEEQATEQARDGRLGDQIADACDETIRMANEFFPSAIGLTFLAEYRKAGLVISARAAIYRSQASSNPEKRLRQWRRTELALSPVVLTFPGSDSHGMRDFPLAENLRVRVIYHRRNDGDFLITVSMLNTKTASPSKPPSGSECFFQIGFDVTDPQGGYVFKEYRKLRHDLSDDIEDLDGQEAAALELLYRNRKAYAVGHGCAAEWGDESDGHTSLVKTSTLPQFRVPPVEPRAAGGDELSMYHLAGAEGGIPPKEVPRLLNKLVDDYESWIEAQAIETSRLPASLQQAANRNVGSCRECLDRIRSGIDLLRQDGMLLEAFMLANRAILMQQYHSRREKRSVNGAWEDLPESYKPKDDTTGRWRTFQLAFILINLPSIAPPTNGSDRPDRRLVDLIWFPTGGGKTEAYLGLAACDIFYRRLRSPSNAGCTVLMRYTLRLLTSQQFQRASSMICACETIRRKSQTTLGVEPISIGLWVGESLTPTYRESALKALNALATKPGQAENPFQLLKCPWCGTALDEEGNLGYVPQKFTGQSKTVAFVCPEQRCPFSKRKMDWTESLHLPVLVIDEDIYAWPPTLIIGTVDKFAMLAWREQAGAIFGIGSENDCDPPDLIIQDELHLISGPLGSVVGLYEGAIDLLCSWKGRSPKIVASTATIRRAWHQCQSLYDRPTFQFPPQGLDIADSFFAAENQKASGRIYVGVFASAAPSFTTALVRTFSAILQSCKSLPLPSGATESVRDPYWTAIGYFNSLRELGHAATLIEADIPEYMWAIASRSQLPRELCRMLASPIELTSRLNADEIPAILDRLTVRYPRTSEEGPRPLDTLLATNMISVGVDVDRLGLMAVIGQPKTTSEYIQASSRVGRSRSAPGLIIAMYNPGKPRDRSHYEHFRDYHAAFYKHVEPTSVTPYSLPVLERALHAVLIVLVRHFVGLKRPDGIDPTDAAVGNALKFIDTRCGNIDPEHRTATLSKLKRLLKDWGDIRPSEWGRFGPPPPSRPLMYPAGTEPLEEWDDSPWPTPASMRNVDVECDARVLSFYPDTD